MNIIELLEQYTREKPNAAILYDEAHAKGITYAQLDDMSGRTMRLSIRTECLESHKFDVRTVVNREIKRLFEENGFKLT